jgi:hypothetical protein
MDAMEGLMGIKRSWTPMAASRWEHFDGAACAGRAGAVSRSTCSPGSRAGAGHAVT